MGPCGNIHATGLEAATGSRIASDAAMTTTRQRQGGHACPRTTPPHGEASMAALIGRILLPFGIAYFFSFL